MVLPYDYRPRRRSSQGLPNANALGSFLWWFAKRGAGGVDRRPAIAGLAWSARVIARTRRLIGILGETRFAVNASMPRESSNSEFLIG